MFDRRLEERLGQLVLDKLNTSPGTPFELNEVMNAVRIALGEDTIKVRDRYIAMAIDRLIEHGDVTWLTDPERRLMVPKKE